VKRWSDLHGDMQSQAEMTWPPAANHAVGGNRMSVPIRCGRRRLERSCPQYERTGTDAALVCQLFRQEHGWLATCGMDKR
jgi:hypothetical protein